jgi:predicted  nucleic acid-binding Zn-ribbon protein
MLAIIIPVNAYLLGGIILFSFLTGFLLRKGQIKSLNKKVLELENEMLSNHADILELQKEKAGLEQRLKELHIPVIPITAKDDSANAKLSDISKRKMSQQTGSSGKN